MSIEDPADIFRGEMHDKYTCQNCKKVKNYKSTIQSVNISYIISI